MFQKIALETTAAPDVNSAVRDLKDEIVGGARVTPNLIAEIAEMYDLKPEVLAIRFEKAFGVPPEQYKAPKTPNIQDIVQEALEKEAKRWRLSNSGQAKLGTRFFIEGEWWLFVAWDGKRVHAVRADTGKVWNFSGRGFTDSILRQVHKPN